MTAVEAAPGPKRRRRVLAIVPAMYLLFVTGEFLTMTHLALALTALGASAFVVGALASSMWIGILCASLVAHRAIAQAGRAPTLVGAALASTLALGSVAAHEVALLWAAGMFTVGVAGGLMWVAGEAWLAEAAPPERRGLLVGLFETAVGVGMLLGPALWPLAVAWGLSPPRVALAIVAVGLAFSLALLPLRHDDAGAQDASSAQPGPGNTPSRGHVASDPAATARRERAWALQLAGIVVASGLLEAGSSALLPSVSVRLGFTPSQAAALGAVIGAGSALLQAPIGGLADRIGHARALRCCWWLLVATSAVLLLRAADPGAWWWAAGFVLGGVGGAVYTLVVIEFGHRLRGAALVRAMSSLVTAYTAGTAAGPALGGALFDATGLPGLAAGLLACSVGGLLAGERASRRAPG